MIKVAIVDDHAVVRMGLKHIIALDKEMMFVGDRPNGDDIIPFLKANKPDVLLLDIFMPGKNGIEVMKEIHEQLPMQKVLMLTTSEADNDVYESLRLGARGYLLKDRDANDIYKAIHYVAEGAKWVPQQVKELLQERKLTPDLTPREQDVLEYLVEGYSNDDIATAMKVSLSAVKAHLKHIFQKLEVEDRVQAVTAALKRGFVHP